jgi:Membrane protein putatively involved in post-translational modification of the autoinducing quorum-sensing peptide
MLRKAAESLHGGMVRNGVSAPSVDVIYYALHVAGNTVSIIGLTLLIGWVTGALSETVLALLSFALIRTFSGGYHLKSGLFCIFASTAVMSAIPHIRLNELWMFAATAAAALLFLLFAPSNLDKYARIAPQYYPLLKAVTTAAVAANFLIRSDVLAVVFLLQGASLLVKNKPEPVGSSEPRPADHTAEAKGGDAG